MTVKAVEMHRHVDRPRDAAAEGRVVLSMLGAGESLISAPAPSLKLLLDGEEIYEIDGRVHRLAAGQMLFVDRGGSCRATVRRNRASLGMCVYLPANLRPAENDLDGLGRVVLRCAAGDRLGRALLDDAARLHRAGSGADAHAVLDRARGMMARALAEAQSQFDRIHAKKATTRRDVLSRLETARGYLYDARHREVLLPELARAAGLSQFHLSRYFTAAFGTSPIRFHRRLRLEEARSLLARRAISATEAAEAVGYAELSSFTRAFAREFGVPPTALRA